MSSRSGKQWTGIGLLFVTVPVLGVGCAGPEADGCSPGGQYSVEESSAGGTCAEGYLEPSTLALSVEEQDDVVRFQLTRDGVTFSECTGREPREGCSFDVTCTEPGPGSNMAHAVLALRFHEEGTVTGREELTFSDENESCNAIFELEGRQMSSPP